VSVLVTENSQKAVIIALVSSIPAANNRIRVREMFSFSPRIQVIMLLLGLLQNDGNFYPGDRLNFLRNGRGLNFFRAREAKIILSPNFACRHDELEHVHQDLPGSHSLHWAPGEKG